MSLTSTAEIKVRFADIDVMGHVNNATYLSYFEQARIEFFHQLIDGDWDWHKDGIVLARNEVDYVYPIHLNDKVEIITKCDRVGGKSLTVSYEVFSIANGKRQLCATGSSVLVSFDYQSGKSVELPSKWRDKLNS